MGGFGKVEIGLLHDLGYATTVATEPLTADDWEIIVSVSPNSLLIFEVLAILVIQISGRTRRRTRENLGIWFNSFFWIVCLIIFVGLFC